MLLLYRKVLSYEICRLIKLPIERIFYLKITLWSTHLWDNFWISKAGIVFTRAITYLVIYKLCKCFFFTSEITRFFCSQIFLASVFSFLFRSSGLGMVPEALASISLVTSVQTRVCHLWTPSTASSEINERLQKQTDLSYNGWSQNFKEKQKGTCMLEFNILKQNTMFYMKNVNIIKNAL